MEVIQELLVIWGALNILIGKVPLRFHHHPVWGKFLTVFGWIAMLVPPESKGTLKLPFQPVPPPACPPSIGVRPAPPRPPPPPPPPPVPPLAAVLALALGACRMPPQDGCTPTADRCHGGRPQVCSASTRWTNADEVCTKHGGVCCETRSAWGGNRVHACVPSERCADGGTP
jgi:hypothetical protein